MPAWFPDFPGAGQRDHPVGGQKIAHILLGDSSADQFGCCRGQVGLKWLGGAPHRLEINCVY
jgi:hypothetical protein